MQGERKVTRKSSPTSPQSDAPANSGRALSRRALFGAGVAMAAPLAAPPVKAEVGAAAAPPEWMLRPGGPFSAYGVPSKWAEPVKRILFPMDGYPLVGTSRTPFHQLEGVITPTGLHFERHHNGVPQIDPALHRLVIHGLVRRPLTFTMDALMRYPMESRVLFIECGGNSAFNTRPEAPQMSAGAIHGLFSTAEWTGVRLSTLLEEAGLEPAAKWVLAEGADSAAMSRSIPIEKCLDDAIVALYQNGEALRAENGFPMRLLLPGFEGNAQVKWLHRLKAVSAPVQSRDETSHYTDLMPNGKARQFVLPIGVKSVIFRPSYGLTLEGPGLYEISGLAWSGHGKVRWVEVSTDGGVSWAKAALGEVVSMAPVRFRRPWRWDGQPAVLLSRATDERGHVQPTRAAWVAQFAPGQNYHCNAIQSWKVSADGKVSNVYI